jgi:hypothetical protein
MSLAGIYGFVYCDNTGVGIGIFSINEGGEVTGSDFAGGRYRGNAHRAANGKVLFDVVFVVARTWRPSKAQAHKMCLTRGPSSIRSRPTLAMARPSIFPCHPAESP